MKASENETIADIVKEKRDTADETELKDNKTFSFDLAKMLREEADRIEAAHRREVEELHTFLHEAIVECCHNFPCCGHWPKFECYDTKSECFVKRWRKALGGATDESK